MEKIEIEHTQYGYATITTFEKTEFFCPSCGIQAIFSDNLGDYYVGVNYYCLDCCSIFNVLECLRKAEGTDLFFIHILREKTGYKVLNGKD